ncbi:uncharacterized protein LOC124341959 isoform X2 [Daphnia pulicaria]|uniref:uncharacterized protein LOC124341959 isoform X2 n=1 Tax=Daphnia pulicaria TaxID=35523 RepID=UPI001EEB1197|nr:uncharacterized protein LOC124341959 isoform X2 [Daphnia pulicaria]
MAVISMKFVVTTCTLMLVCMNPAQSKPFSTNINTNYNNNYNTNMSANFLISSLLNYIFNLLEVLQKNEQCSGQYTIPAFPRPDEMHPMLRQHPPAALPESEPPASADPAFVKDGINKDDGSPQDFKEDIEAAVEAFRGPATPPLLSPIPLDSFGLRTSGASSG